MNTQQFIRDHGLDALDTQLNITICKREMSNGQTLLSLDYSKTLSPKWHPVTRECRGLLLDMSTLAIIHRPMKRFFNANEDSRVRARFPKDDFPDPQAATEVTAEEGQNPPATAPVTSAFTYLDVAFCCEKIDGSLIKLYFYDGEWRVGTRGTVIGDNLAPTSLEIGIPHPSFQELVFRAVGVANNDQFQAKAVGLLDPVVSYNCEVTSLENRFVTPYPGYTLWFLSACYRDSGEYVQVYEEEGGEGATVAENVSTFGLKFLPKLSFETTAECLTYVEAMEDLREGVVAYSAQHVPLFKYKNKAWKSAQAVAKQVSQCLLNNSQKSQRE